MNYHFFAGRRTAPQAGVQTEPEWHLLQPVLQKRIAVVGISRGAGASFIAQTLAFLLQKSKFAEECRKAEVPVTYIQMRQPQPGESMVFFEAGLDQRFGKKAFLDGEEGADVLHLHRGINWSVWRQSRRQADQQMDGAECTEALCCSGSIFRPFPENVPGRWVVADSPPLETLRRYDLVVGLVDPLPGRVYAGAETYEVLRDLEAAGLPVLWVLNRDSREVNHSALNRFLKRKEWTPMPLMNPELVYRAQYTCCLPVELMEGACLEAAEGLAEKVENLALAADRGRRTQEE